jgi:hypothetical protein
LKFYFVIVLPETTIHLHKAKQQKLNIIIIENIILEMISSIVFLVLLCGFADHASSTSFIPKLYYFDIAGKAEAIRLACVYSDFNFEDIRLSREEFTNMKST